MRIILAPMEGLVDAPIRETLTKVGGIDRCVTEFIRVTHGMLPPRIFYKYAPELYNGALTEVGTPVAVQLLGSNADMMGRHGAKAAELGAGQVDINFGCPAPKVCRNDAGAALLRDPDRVVEMVRACLDVAKVPITVKVRLGTGGGPNTALEVAERLEAEGIERICVHGRTLRQRYSGTADWEQIRDIVEAVDIPVIANGDVVDAATASACLEATGAAGLMIGRGAIGRPTIFHDIKRDLGWSDQAPTWGDGDPAVARLWCWKRYLELSGELYTVQENKNLKRHAVSFTKGLPGASAMRVELHSIGDQAELGRRVTEYLEELAELCSIAA